jgi:hypothetical protein
MPCFTCGARQTDPVRGASPWKRGVRADRQVLICPRCQHASDWAAELDRCAACDSTVLVCRLGEVECRTCGHVRSADRSTEDPPPTEAPGLSAEVAQALDRVLKKDQP